MTQDEINKIGEKFGLCTVCDDGKCIWYDADLTDLIMYSHNLNSVETQEQIEALKALAEQIAIQDNRITADPLFVVFQKREIVTNEDYDHDFIGWFDEEGNRADEETAVKLDEMYSDTKSDWFRDDEITLEDEEEGDTEWRRLAIKEVDEFATACFTEQGANDYIKACGYRLNKPFIFVDSLYRNREMIGLREYILSRWEHGNEKPQ